MAARSIAKDSVLSSTFPVGAFLKGADPVYPEEGPAQKVFVSPFRLQVHEVTNSQFADFVAATGYLTEAERNGGSAQFNQSQTPEVFMSWWKLDPTATWKTPQGAGTDVDGPGALSGRSHNPQRRARLCGLGRGALAHRGGMGIRGEPGAFRLE